MTHNAGIIDASVGSLVRERRETLSLSQSDIAEKLGISVAQLQSIESGLEKIGPSSLQRICDILDVSPMYFFRSNAADIVPMKETWYALQAISEDATTLASAYVMFEDVKKRNKIRNFIQSLDSGSQSDGES